MENVSCNICKSDETKKLFTIHSMNVVKCKRCGLIYVNPRYTGAELKSIYSEGYFDNPNFYESGLDHYGYDKYFIDKKNIQQNFMHRLEQISKFVDKGVILDIGCAAGFFLDLARSNGWKTEGIELSKEAVNYARNKLKLNVKISDIGSSKFKKNYYDAITIFDVIEHLPNPREALIKINKSLKTGGILAITTPDIGSFVANIMGKNWPEVKRVREHIYFFSEKTLGELLSRTGFKLVRKETTGRYFALGSALEYAGAYNKLYKYLSTTIKILGLGKFKIYIDPMYKMSVYAEKVLDLNQKRALKS